MGMKGGFSPGNALGALAGGPAFVSYRQGKKAEDIQKRAMNQAEDNARATAELAQQAFNKSNQKRPNTSGMLSSNQMAAQGGQSGTLLTGPGGIDPSFLKLGKTTLLGGGGGG
jgi:hypothetical protein